MEVTRAISLSRGVVNMETGEFPMILASETMEAADNHVFGVERIELPESVPMLFNHESNSDIATLGVLHSFRKDVDTDGVKIVRNTAQFLLNGSDEGVALRTDFAFMVDSGAMPGASARWNGDGVARSSLGREHKFYGERGLLFETPNILEGSIVALGMDVKAASGRADNAKFDSQRMFWRVMMSTEENSDGMRDVGRAVQEFNKATQGLVDVGCSPDDAIRLAGVSVDEPVFVYRVGDKEVYLPADVFQQISSNERQLLKLLLEKSAEADTVAGTSRKTEAEVSTTDTDGSERKPEAAPDWEAIAAGLQERLVPAIRKEVGNVVYEATGRRL